MQRPRNQLRIILKLLVTASLAIFGVMSIPNGRTLAQDFPALVGRIEGDDLAVVTTTTSGVESNAAPTVVASGSEITLRSGHALLSLNSGGTISVCGPAHFKLVKSEGAITLALDYGRVHPTLNSTEIFTIYTPTIVATPIAISGTTRELTLGLEEGGEMCAVTTRGAMRVDPQFSDQSLIIPQGGVATLSGGQIESLAGDANSCSCDFPRASLERARPVTSTREIGVLSHPSPAGKDKIGIPPATPAADEPVYTVIMPPLTYDANSLTPPDPDPSTILLVREVRMRSASVYRGHVNPAPAEAIITAQSMPAPQTHAEARPSQPQSGFMDRVRNFFRKL
jgi:hypothetical protein